MNATAQAQPSWLACSLKQISQRHLFLFEITSVLLFLHILLVIFAHFLNDFNQNFCTVYQAGVSTVGETSKSKLEQARLKVSNQKSHPLLSGLPLKELPETVHNTLLSLLSLPRCLVSHPHVRKLKHYRDEQQTWLSLILPAHELTSRVRVRVRVL